MRHVLQELICRVLLITCSVVLSACSGGGGIIGHPKINEAQIGTDLVGKNTGEGLLGWKFEKDEPREIAVLQRDYSGEKATIVIDIKTESAPGRFSRQKWAGKLRLHYEWVAGVWTLVQVENLDFKER